jgi:small conductance mechanosensitive channel
MPLRSLFAALTLLMSSCYVFAQEAAPASEIEEAVATENAAMKTEVKEAVAAENEAMKTEVKEAVAVENEAMQAEVKQAVEALSEGDVKASVVLAKYYVMPVVIALLLVIVGYLGGKWLGRVVRRPIEAKVDKTLGRFVGKLIFYAVMAFTVAGVLGRFGVSVASFAAVIGAAGFAIGLAFQGSLGNFAAGVLLLVFRPFKVGDVINAAGITAKVVEIDLFTTVFDTFDNRRIIVPNSQISGGTIENITHHSERRVDINVGAAYDANIDATRDALTRAVESLDEFLVKGEGRGFQIMLLDLGDSSVNWVVRFWTKRDDFGKVKELLTRAIKMHMDEAGIGIPFPQMDVHLFKED